MRIALIPARGGSKGIPRKNLERVGGRSLIARSIDHARACDGIDHVYVTTDDGEIATEAEQAGAMVIDRPVALAGDTATTESAVVHALDHLCEEGIEPDLVVLLQCTSPFRSPGQLDEALRQFDATGCDSLLSVTKFHQFVWTPQPGGRGYRPLTYEPSARPRRQDIGEVYCETGSFYVFRPALLRNTGSRLGGHVEVFCVPEHDGIEIDSPADLDRARMMAAADWSGAQAELAQVQWLVLDVDGTLTDGAMYYAEGGEISKRFDTRDGFGLRLWREAGGKVAWISGEASEAAARRASKLQIDHVVLGVTDKAAALQSFMERFGVDKSQVLAMGDDLNDLDLAGGARLFVAPANARAEVLARADLVTQSAGGYGAVRELTDWLLHARQRMHRATRAA